MRRISDWKRIEWPDVEPSSIVKLTTNLLQNAGFEQDDDRDGVPDRWRTFVSSEEDVTCTWDSGLGRAGSRCVSVECKSPDGAGMWQQIVPVKAGAVYILSGYVGFENIPQEGRCNLQLVFRDRNNEIVKTVDFPDHRGTRKLAYDFPRELMVRAPERATNAEVNLILRGQGKAMFDDVFFGLAPVGDIAGTVKCQGAPLEGVRVAIWDKPWGAPCEAVTDRSGAYRISGVPVTLPRYVVLTGKEGYKTKPQGEVGVTAGGTTTLNFDLQHGRDPVDDLHVMFGSLASVRGLPPLEIPADAIIPPDASGYPEGIRPYLGTDDFITPNDPTVAELAKKISGSLSPEMRTNTRDVAYAVFSWVSQNIEHDGVHVVKVPQKEKIVIQGNQGRVIPTEDAYEDHTSGVWQTVTGEGWCWGYNFLDWGWTSAETLRDRGVICAEMAWLCCAVLRNLNVPARAALGANEFWAQRRNGDGQWIFMSTTSGRTGFREQGSLEEGFGGVRAPTFYSVLSRPLIHEDWFVRNKCMFREIHPFQEFYEGASDGLQRALKDLDAFKSTGTAPTANGPQSPPAVGYMIHYSDLTINLYNIGEQRSLDVRFPFISESEVYTYAGHEAYWTNHPECVRRTWIEEITIPPVKGKERWFHIEFDLTSLVDAPSKE